MNRLLGVFVLILLIGGFILYRQGVLNTFGKGGANGADTRKCVAHLRAIEGSIVATLLQNEKLDIVTAISDIGQKEGYSFFRCQPFTNDWVAINPDGYRWEHGNKFSNEVSLYCPQPGEINVWKARNFAGDDIILSNRPPWLPVAVWELEKKR